MDETVNVGDSIEVTEGYYMRVVSPETGEMLEGNVHSGTRAVVTKVLKAMKVVQFFKDDKEFWVPFSALVVVKEEPELDIDKLVHNMLEVWEDIVNGDYDDSELEHPRDDDDDDEYEEEDYWEDELDDCYDEGEEKKELFSIVELVKMVDKGDFEDGTIFHNTKDGEFFPISTFRTFDGIYKLMDEDGDELILSAELLSLEWYEYKSEERYYLKSKEAMSKNALEEIIEDAKDEGVDLKETFDIIEVGENGEEQVNNDLFY